MYINHYAGSPEIGMAFRPYYMAKEWSKSGHNVTIIGATYSHLRKKQPACNGSVTEQVIDGIKYLWLKTPAYSGSGLKRMMNMFMFTTRLFLLAKKITKEFTPDVVIASSTYPFDIFPAARIAKLSGAKLVFETHDLWPLTPMSLGGYSKLHPFIVMLQLTEDYMCRKVDKIISMLPYADKHYVTRGMSPEKYYYVPNGVVKQDWDDPEELPQHHKEIIDKLKKDGCFLVGYAGGLFLSNAMEYVVDSMKHVKASKVKIIILGSGAMQEELVAQAKLIPGDKVVFLPAVSKKVVPSFLEKMDVLISSDPKSDLYQYGVSPNKIYDYMMSGKAIICATEAANDIVGDAKCGFTVKPEDPTAIANAIDKVVGMNAFAVSMLGENGRTYVMKNNEYSVLAKKFLEALK